MLQELSDLNNSFTHYFFVWSQFSLDYEQVIAANNSRMTSAVFIENEFSGKHNVQLAKLEKEHSKTNTTLLNGIFTLIYSSFENYLTEVYSLARKIDNSLLELNEGKFEQDDVLILKVINRLGVEEGNFDKSYLLTLDYIRLKRNRLIHHSSTHISRSLRENINKNGSKLNIFWNSMLPKHLQGIDFSNNDNGNQITYNILIDTLNILRGTANYIDLIVFDSFQKSEFLLKEILVEFKTIHKIKNYNLADEKNRRRFLGFCKVEYGIEPTDNDFLEMV